MKVIMNIDNSMVNEVSQIIGTGNVYNDILFIALLILMIIVLAAAVVILKAMRGILRLNDPNFEVEEKARKVQVKKEKAVKRKQIWNNILGLRPIEEEKDIMIDHSYDDITELDNPIPVWFNGLFYSSIVFGVIYLLTYHVFGWGMLQDQEYEYEVAQAEIARQAYLAQAANLVDENTVVLDFDPAVIQAGSAIFSLNCAVCHGANGEGGIGPNLTDDYYLHGGDVKDIFKVVKYGVPEKGMVPWEQSLTPAQISEVSNYIMTLVGTTPANPKEPQGTLYVPEETNDSEETESDVDAVPDAVTE